MVSIKHATAAADRPSEGLGEAQWDADHIVPIASQVEAEEGIATDKLMTPQRTTQAINAVVGTGVARAPHDFWQETWFSANGATSPDRWTGAAVSSGTNNTAIPAGSIGGKFRHGVFLRSSTTANGGYRYQTSVVAGDTFGQASHKFICTFKWLTSFTGRLVRLGFHDTSTSADATDGAYFEINGNVCSAKTANNGTRTTNGTTITLSLDIPYVFDIEVNAAGTDVVFSVTNGDTGELLYEEVISTNIPTSTTRSFGSGIVATESSTTASDMGILYYLGEGTINGHVTALRTLKGDQGIQGPPGLNGAGSVDIQAITSSTTWTNPGTGMVLVEIWGAGGGGGSGTRSAAGNVRYGGFGGGGGGYRQQMFRAADLPSTVLVTIGAGGAGGASSTTDNTAGSTGGNGGTTTFGDIMKVGGGSFGGNANAGWPQAGGGAAFFGGFGDGNYGDGGGGYADYYGSTGAVLISGGFNGGGFRGGNSVYGGAGGGVLADLATDAGTGFTSLLGGCGGGSGGSIGSSNTVISDGKAGGSQNGDVSLISAGGVPGYGGGGGAGGVNANGSAGGPFQGGGGGGPVAAGNTTRNGGAGGIASGGGGGAASTNGTNSGAGGAGGNGYARITTWG